MYAGSDVDAVVDAAVDGSLEAVDETLGVVDGVSLPVLLCAPVLLCVLLLGVSSSLQAATPRTKPSAIVIARGLM